VLRHSSGGWFSLGDLLLCSGLPGLTWALPSVNGAGNGVILLLRARDLRLSVPFVQGLIARSIIAPLPVAARGVHRISHPLSALPLEVLHALILLGVLIATSPTPLMTISALCGTIGLIEIGSRRDTKRCMSRNVCGLPPLTIPQAVVVDHK
jgi:hypothetical protein